MHIVLNNKEYKIIYAKTFFKRLKGFMFKRNIDYCICFPKTNSIHTFFMKENIDVLMTNKDNKVLYKFKNLRKNRIILPKRKVYYTYELPINSIKDININDYIKIRD